MLSSVSETAIITLKSRVIESAKENGLIQDPMGKILYEKLLKILDGDLKGRIINRKTPQALSVHIAIRGRQYDRFTLDFLKKYPDGLVVSLGCGFDTRYWRIGMNKDNYIELDFPEIINVKKELLGDLLDYRTMSDSIFETAWMNKVKNLKNHHVLFIAEGLLMYLPEEGVIKIFENLAENFTESEIIFEVVNKKYTKGINKKIVEMKMKHALGNDAGSSYNFGVEDPEEVEGFHPGLKVIEEWSYFEAEDIKPKILKFLGRFKTFTRTQWTMRAKING